jgi:hypothetical protein
LTNLRHVAVDSNGGAVLGLIQVDADEMLSAMLEAVGATQQLALLGGQVARVLAQRGRITPVDQHYPHLPSDLWPLYRDALTTVINEGIVGPGFNSENAWWPWFSLTRYGQECLAENALLPHDPARFIDQLQSQMPVDDVEQRFVAQAIEAQRLNLPDASAVMLGSAAEHLILLLGQKIVQSDPSDSKTAKLIRTGPAKALLDQVKKRLDAGSGGKQLPRQLEERRDTVFAGIADVIRVARNDSGNPTIGSQMDRMYCFVLLRMYREYRAWIAETLQHI